MEIFIDKLLQFLHEFNIQTIISMIFIVWYFTRDIKADISKLDRDLREEISKLDRDFKEMNTRVSRVEGTVYGKDIYKNIDSK